MCKYCVSKIIQILVVRICKHNYICYGSLLSDRCSYKMAVTVSLTYSFWMDPNALDCRAYVHFVQNTTQNTAFT